MSQRISTIKTCLDAHTYAHNLSLFRMLSVWLVRLSFFRFSLPFHCTNNLIEDVVRMNISENENFSIDRFSRAGMTNWLVILNWYNFQYAWPTSNCIHKIVRARQIQSQTRTCLLYSLTQIENASQGSLYGEIIFDWKIGTTILFKHEDVQMNSSSVESWMGELINILNKPIDKIDELTPYTIHLHLL